MKRLSFVFALLHCCHAQVSFAGADLFGSCEGAASDQWSLRPAGSGIQIGEAAVAALDPALKFLAVAEIELGQLRLNVRNLDLAAEPNQPIKILGSMKLHRILSVGWNLAGNRVVVLGLRHNGNGGKPEVIRISAPIDSRSWNQESPLEDRVLSKLTSDDIAHTDGLKGWIFGDGTVAWEIERTDRHVERWLTVVSLSGKESKDILPESAEIIPNAKGLLVLKQETRDGMYYTLFNAAGEQVQECVGGGFCPVLKQGITKSAWLALDQTMVALGKVPGYSIRHETLIATSEGFKVADESDFQALDGWQNRWWSQRGNRSDIIVTVDPLNPARFLVVPMESGQKSARIKEFNNGLSNTLGSLHLPDEMHFKRDKVFFAGNRVVVFAEENKVFVFDLPTPPRLVEM